MRGQSTGVAYRQLQLLAGEFTAPLQYLAAASEFISAQAGQPLTPEALRHLKLMTKTSQRLLQLSELLLMRQGILDGQMALQFEPVNMAAMARSSLDNMLRLHDIVPRHEEVAVSYEAWPADSDRRVLGGALDALSAALVETATQPEQAVCRVVRRESTVQLEIIDDGPIFTRREMAHSAEQSAPWSQPFKASSSNVTISLSIARDLIQALKGHLSIARLQDDRRQSIVRLPMTTQLPLVGV